MIRSPIPVALARPIPSLLLPATAMRTPSWMRRFQFAADFRSGFVRLGGRRVSMETIDSLYHSRWSARRAEDGQGVSREYGSGVMALTDRGYDSREGWTNLVGAADFATATLGVIGTGGSLPGWVATAPATAGLTTEVVELLTYKGYPAARVRVYGTWNGVFWEMRPGEQQGLTEGLVYTSSIVVAERQCPGSAAPQVEVSWRSAPASGFVSAETFWTAAEFIDVSSPDSRSISRACPVGASRIRVRLRSDEPRWVAGNFIDFTCVVAAPQVTQTAYPMPFGTGTIAPDSLVIPASSAGLAVDPSVTGLTMVWRGRDFESASEFPLLLEARGDVDNRMSFFRTQSSGLISLSGRNAGSNSVVATLAQAPRATDTTVLLTWRPDGTAWGKIGTQPAATFSRSIFSLPVSVGVGCNGVGSDRINSRTHIAAAGAFALTDADALALFNAVAAA